MSHLVSSPEKHRRLMQKFYENYAKYEKKEINNDQNKAYAESQRVENLGKTIDSPIDLEDGSYENYSIQKKTFKLRPPILKKSSRPYYYE